MSRKNDNILDDNFNSNEEENDIVIAEETPASKFGILMAIVSFVLGSLLFFGALTSYDNFGFVLVGFYYTIIAFMVNLVFFLFLCIKSGTPGERKAYRKSAGIMALNIPIALIYLRIILGMI